MGEFVGELMGKCVPFDSVSEPDGSTPYTLSQVKAAFWAVFHLSGEIYFSAIGTKAQCDSCTQSEWEDFIEALEKAKGNGDAMDQR